MNDGSVLGGTGVTDAPRQSSRRHDRRPTDGTVTRLVDGCRQGEQQAWRDVVEQYTPLVLTVARSLGLRQADCEDVCQATWIHVVRSIDTIQQPDKLPTWIVTVARREGIKSIESTAHQISVADVEPVDDRVVDSGPEEAAVAKVDERRVLAALRALPEPHRQLIELLHTDPAPTYDQISARLNIPRGSIGPTRSRILRTMQAFLENDHQNLGTSVR